MIRPFLFALCAAAAFAEQPSAAQPAGKLPVRAPSGGRERQGQVSARTLFGLVARSTCSDTLTGPLCPQGDGCCYIDDECCGEKMCLLKGEACCDGQYSCVTGESCCSGGCIPEGTTCCGDGTYSFGSKSDCYAGSPLKAFSAGPTFTDRYGLSGSGSGSTSTSSFTGYGVFTSPTSTPTFGAISGNSVSGDCGSAQKVLNGGAANKGGGGHGGGGGGGHSSGGDSGSSGSSSGDSSSSGSSGSGFTSGSGPAGCASSASIVVLSMGTLVGAFVGTIILL